MVKKKLFYFQVNIIEILEITKNTLKIFNQINIYTNLI